MKSVNSLFGVSTLLASLLPMSNATPAARPERQVLICSDSTTATYGPSSLIQGWGYYAHNFFNLNITNLARGGRSTRSFINEGLWAALLERVVPGEGTFVIIEMGHNDDGNPTTDVKNRATLPGVGNESVVVPSNVTGGAPETVYTFGHYLRKMIHDVRQAGGVPLLSGMVPRMYWKGDVLQLDWPFADYTREVAEEEGVEYIDHTKYAGIRWQAFGTEDATKPYYPLDHTHTSWPGAEINTEAFVTAVKCGHAQGTRPSQLTQYLNTNATNVKYPC